MSHASAAAIRRDVAALLRPPRRINVSQAVAESMRVSGPSGSWIPWDATATPYMIEPMDMLNSREFDAEVFVGPARTGKTQALIDGWVAYDVKSDPSDFLVVQISREKAAEFSKKRIDRMFSHSPALAECMSPRANDNNIHDKIFRAGNYLKIGWPTKTILASSDYRRVAITDYDRLPPNIDNEGDGFTLGKKRTQVFMSRGMTLAESSPGFEVTDRDWRQNPEEPHMAPPTLGILSLYNLGDRRILYWACPECGEYFPAQFKYLRWPQDEADILAASEQVTCCCPRCGVADIPPGEKDGMLQSCRWVKEGQQILSSGELEGKARRSRIASFWMEGPAAAFQTWSSLVYEYLKAEADYQLTGSQEKLKTTVNVDQGRPYLYRTSNTARDPERLRDRSDQNLAKRVVPVGVRFLVASVDVQAGKNRRFVVQVHGFGVGLECWLIDRYNIKKSDRKDDKGNVQQVHPGTHAEDWALLTKQVLERGYPLSDASGRLMKPKLMVCDHGGEDGVSANAYDYYRTLKRQGLHRSLMLVKGGSRNQIDKVKESWPDNTKRKDRKTTVKKDVPLHILGTNLLKDWVSNYLDKEEEGPGYIHFPFWLGDWFYEELTAEDRATTGEWVKSGSKPNEGFDLFAYALAGCVNLKADRMNWGSPPRWALPWDDNDMVFAPEEPTAQATETTHAKPIATRRSRFRF